MTGPTRPILLDAFCKAGGAAKGYQRAGFYVVGIDIEPQPNYCGDEFVQADALDYLRTIHVRCSPTCRDGYAAVHASPPCQFHMESGMVRKDRAVNLIPPTRALLEQMGLPYVIENVPGARKTGPMRADLTLCGSMFGLQVRRHRIFESNVQIGPWPPASCDHSQRITGVYGHPHGEAGAYRNTNKPMLPSNLETWSTAMGIDWMTAAELAQAIPPDYTEFIGRRLLSLCDHGAAHPWDCPDCHPLAVVPSRGVS